MRVIDPKNWPRRGHFELYRGLPFPNVNICVQLGYHGVLGTSKPRRSLAHRCAGLLRHQGSQSGARASAAPCAESRSWNTK